MSAIEERKHRKHFLAQRFFGRYGYYRTLDKKPYESSRAS